MAGRANRPWAFELYVFVDEFYLYVVYLERYIRRWASIHVCFESWKCPCFCFLCAWIIICFFTFCEICLRADFDTILIFERYFSHSFSDYFSIFCFSEQSIYFFFINCCYYFYCDFLYFTSFSVSKKSTNIPQLREHKYDYNDYHNFYKGETACSSLFCLLKTCFWRILSVHS